MTPRKKSLLVTLRAREPSIVELTVDEKVQIDRVIASSGTSIAERHGPLLAPGRTRLALDPGVYCFKTLSPANLRVVRGGVDVGTTQGKDPWPQPPPPPPPTATTEPPLGDAPITPTAGGDDPPGTAPFLTVE